MEKPIKTNNLGDKDSSPALQGSFQNLDIPQLAIDSANIGIWIMDTATGSFFPSGRTKELFGLLPEDEMSFDVAMMQVADKERKNVTEAIENAIAKRLHLYLEFPLSGQHEKKQNWLSVSGGFSNSDQGNSFFSGIMMDITEQKQNDLRRSRFIGIVSHELKTPLTALKAYIQMLNTWAKKQKDNFTIGALSKVDKQVKKMLNMINGLLNLSGAESGKIHLNKEDFLLDELIGEVIEETKFITSTHNIIMACGEPIKVHADREKIEQVLVNLLSNAAKYSGQDKPIEISCILKDKEVKVCVIDMGMGIDRDEIARLFEPHYRVENKETQKISGFGIGLYLCAEIIKRHHGKIWVESEIGKGSAFSFTLPL